MTKLCSCQNNEARAYYQVIFFNKTYIILYELDGSLSDTAVSHLHGLEVPQRDRKENRDRDRDRQSQFSGLNKKSNSTSQLSATGKTSVY